MNLRNKLRQLSQDLKIIEMYNYHYILGAEKDIKILKDKLNTFQNLPGDELKRELATFSEVVNLYFKDIPVDFIKQYNYYIQSLEQEMF